jgi:hypothetical protein
LKVGGRFFANPLGAGFSGEHEIAILAALGINMEI